MSTSKIILIGLASFILIICFWGCNGYNGLISADQSVKKFGVTLKPIIKEEQTYIAVLSKQLKGLLISKNQL